MWNNRRSYVLFALIAVATGMLDWKAVGAWNRLTGAREAHANVSQRSRYGGSQFILKPNQGPDRCARAVRRADAGVHGVRDADRGGAGTVAA